MKIKGLDELSRKLNELEKVTAALDGNITSVDFTPDDPQSIELAVKHMEAAIDERVANLKNNELVQEFVAEMKERYRQVTIDRAASARAKGESE